MRFAPIPERTISQCKAPHSGRFFYSCEFLQLIGHNYRDSHYVTVFEFPRFHPLSHTKSCLIAGLKLT
jgi:hypothetical protein